jgi:hypothetical protein
VLALAIPNSPLAAGTAAPLPPAPPPPKPEPVPEAASSEVFEVPPLVEPIADSKAERAPDLPARIMSEIAAIVAQAPEAIAPVAVDLSALKAPELAAASPASPPQPTPASRPRTEPARRVTVRRARPRVGRPQSRITALRLQAKAATAGKPSDRLDRAGSTAKLATPRPAPAPTPLAPPALPTPSLAAKAPARERPALAPASTAVARTTSTLPVPAAVPETRPLTQNRRLYRRVRLTAELEVAGKPCRLVDLSIGGFAAAGADRLDPGALVPVTLRMTIDGINIGTQFSARMVYGNGARAAGRFVELTGAQTAFLRYIVTWRGEAIGAVGTTTLLDAITRWPERAFQPHPSTVKAPAAERSGFWTRLIGRIPLLGWRKRDQ